MTRYRWIILSISCLLIIHQYEAREVTNEDIRDAILSLVHMVRAGEDKLERHEYRERQLGEHLKKQLAGLEKRHRNLEPIKGTLGRLDERLANVETILLQKDERERIQLQKTNNALEEIKNNLVTWMANVELLKSSVPPPTPAAIQAPANNEEYKQLLEQQKDLTNKVDGLSSKIDSIKHEINKVQNESVKIKQLNEISAKNLDQVEGQLKSSEQLLKNYENRLEELNNKIPELQADKQDEDWKNVFLNVLESHRDNIERISADIKEVGSKISYLPDSTEASLNHNQTLGILEELRYDIAAKSEKSAEKVKMNLKEIEKAIDDKLETVITTNGENVQLTENIMDKMAKSYDEFRTDLQSLGKVEKVMLQTADNVMDTKRRVEYGVHQIILEIGEFVLTHNKELNNTINNRFDSIELTILDNQTGALANLSMKLEQEMSQVWRQIGIMYQELTASTTALDRLQNQTELYVNGSLSTMDSMEGKVGKITTRMREVDENLNYLLGRLSLITQEFNDIRTGLGQALDNIKGSFQTVKEKLKDSGPGPHKISSNEQPEPN